MEQYYVSFDPINEMKSGKEHFDDQGFVVFHNIFTKEECKSTRQQMTSFLEHNNVGFKMNDPLSWDLLKGTGKYGLSCRGPCFESVLVNNRQNPILATVLSALIETDIPDVMVSHDRFTVYRATELGEFDISDGEKYSTDRKNVHLDLNPWWHYESSSDITHGLESLQYNDKQDFIRENNLVVESMGYHIQCVLNFHDNQADDGGTIVVPKFHHRMKEWAHNNIHLRKPLPWVQFPAKECKEELELLTQSVRVPMREGSVLLWDQRLMHGSSPNKSARCRYAQFLKAYSRSRSFRTTAAAAAADASACLDSQMSLNYSNGVYSTERLLRRALALQRALQEQVINITGDSDSDIDCNTECRNNVFDTVSSLGKSLFGLDVLDGQS